MGGAVKKGGCSFLFLGILVMLLGIASMSAPLLTGLAITVMVGSMLLVSGVVQVFHGFKVLGGGAKFWAILVGVLTVVVGVLVLMRPVSALAGLTLILACFFVADGILTAIAAFQARPTRGWGWLLFSAVVTLLLGGIIWMQWPVSGAWAIGILIGVRILMAGLTMIFVGSAVRGIGREMESQEKQANLQTSEGVIEAEAEEVKEE